MSSKRHETGAALVIAISIMTILLAIALTFFALTRVELQTATNVTHSVRADHLAEAAIAIAVHMLNEDFERNPAATSTDHAWRSFFNGAAFAGKQWAMRGAQWLAAGGIPQVDMTQPIWVKFNDGHVEQLYRGERTRPWLFIPRSEGGTRILYADVTRVDPSLPIPLENQNLGFPFPVANYDRDNPNSPPFVTSDIYGTNPFGMTGYPAEQVHQWADVDNSGDGLRDSMWIPIPADVFFPDDGVDNNLNGLVDEPPDPSVEGEPPDLPVETGVFVYNGCCDGLDNNGNGLVDDPSENKLFLTAPLPGIWIPVDLNGDGIPDMVPIMGNEGPALVPLMVKVPNSIRVEVNPVRDLRDPQLPAVRTPEGFFVYEDALGNVSYEDPSAYSTPAKLIETLEDRFIDNAWRTIWCYYRLLGPEEVDVIDNDYDMFINNYNTYAYVGPNNTNPRLDEFQIPAYLLPGNLPPADNYYAPPYRVQGFEISGQDVTVKINPLGVNSSAQKNEDGLVSIRNDNDDPHNNYDGRYEIGWQHPKNWFGNDSSLYDQQRAAAYTDINIDMVMGGYGALEYRPEFIVYAYAPDRDITQAQTVPTRALLGNSLRITHSGEPVCELAGRAAILIIDEASKVNLNIAGAHVYTPFDNAGNPVPPPSLWRALGDGAGPWEYETRMLPHMGIVRAANLWGLLMGSPDGRPFGDADINPNAIPYQYDVSLPGYGRVDDSGTALLAALTGAPNYLRLPNTDPQRDRRDPDQIYRDLAMDPLGLFKGIDDPQELRRYNPRRNLIAERDGVDNNRSGVADEPGELGDRQLQNIEQIRQANQIGSGIFNDLRPFVTVFSTDRNVDFLRDTSGVIRAVNQLDYNQTTAQQIAAHLIRQGEFVPFFRSGAWDFRGLDPNALYFAQGLRMHDTLRAPRDGMLRTATDGATTDEIPGDPQLAALQAAVTVVDARDADHARTELTTPRDDRIAWNSPYAPWPTEFSLRERVAQESVFPAEEIEAHLNTLGINLNVDNEDNWWARFVESDQTDSNGNPLPEGRRFQHTVAGIESIRINEMMVRPVRRVEAEMNYGEFNFNPQPYGGMVGFILTVMQTKWNGSAYGLPYAVNDTTEPWRRVSAYNPWTGAYETVLGDRTVLRNDGTDDPIEFIFQESTGLPAGRYYLKVNTIDYDVNGNPYPTINGGGQLQYVIKYVNTAAGDPTILQDVASATTGPPWVSVPAAHIGGRPGEPEGWVFLDGTAIDPPDVDDPTDPFYPYRNYFRDGGPLEAGDPPGLGRRTHTVWVPPADSGYALCVALRRVDGGPLAINFFDFSQEPDHEWIEITNISDDPVDLSGWELEVGIPDPPNVNELVDPPLDAFKSRWRVPNGTRIAPKGYLLLGFDSVGQRGQINNAKFDRYKTPDISADPALGFDTNKINANGIGLAAGILAPGESVIPDISGVTVPPIFDTSAIAWPTDHPFYDLTGSVFRRDYWIDPINNIQNPNFRDYVDNHGDGISAQHTQVLARLQTLIATSNNPEVAEAAQVNRDQFMRDAGLVSTRNDGPNVTPRGNKPWDRIVALENLQLWRENPIDPKSRPITLDDITTVDMVARMVLRGGILPNYPERDGIDNDGDGAYLEWGFVPHPDPDIGGFLDLTGDGNPDRVPTRYVPGILDLDMVDNDLNGLVDERGVGVPRNLRYYVNEYAGDLPHNPFLSEGVDEGRPNAFRRYGPGSYEPGTLPAVFFNSRAAYPTREEYNDYGAFNSSTDSPAKFLTYDNYTDDPAAEHVNPLPDAWRSSPGMDFPRFPGAPAEVFFFQRQSEMIYVMQPGRKYLVTFTLDGPVNPGAVQVRLGDTVGGLGNTGLWRTAPGIYRETLTCDATDEATLYIIAAPGTVCEVTGISVRPVHGPKGINTALAAAAGRLWRMGDARQDGSLYDARYLGTDEDPLEWKAFVERRWNPGDNVIVTLYEGPAEQGRVADRVTYREYDVINRTVDDVLPTPYADSAGNPVGLHPDYPRLWLPDHMGLDFYRSLERKHPLHTGDRFGTANRWTPTDGNYDDWADSMSVFLEILTPEAGLNAVLEIGNFNRFTSFEARLSRDVNRLQRHAFFASPLRMNFAARVAENPPDLARVVGPELRVDLPGRPSDRPYGQFDAYDNPWFRFEYPTETPNRQTQSHPNQDWAIARVLFPNAPIETGDIARLPLFSHKHTLFNTFAAGFLQERRFLQTGWNPNMAFVQGGYDESSNTPLAFQATPLRGALMARQSDPMPDAVWQTLTGSATQDSVVLTVAEARYIPIRPDPRYVASSPSLNELLQWRRESGVWRAPALWAPVYLFELPGDVNQVGLPPFPDGFSLPGVIFDRRYLFDTDYLFNTVRLFGPLTPAQLAERWPLARRAAMYVSEARIGVEGRPNEPVAPEALFTWDAETGLENGDYYLYVGTFIPKMREQLQQVSSMLWQGDADFVIRGLLKSDSPAGPFRPALALEVITDPTQAQGLGGAGSVAGLTPPPLWMPPLRYEPRPDGLIPYGDTGSGTWLPRTVRVTNNFLALRVRNVGLPGDVAVLTHIVLTPRKRVPGKININTAENHLVEVGARYQFFNPIMGLPGVVRALESVRDPRTGNIIGGAIGPTDDIGLPSGPVTTPLPPPSAFVGGRAVPPTRNTTEFLDLLADPGDTGIAAMRLAAQIMAGRPEHPDGRYYKSVTELLSENGFIPEGGISPIYPLSNEDDPRERFDQVLRRFSQIVNLITVRSDVFEIIATVQAGYGVDLNGDGFINYRSNEEFITTAETKTRLVYERRAPAARADEAAMR